MTTTHCTTYFSAEVCSTAADALTDQLCSFGCFQTLTRPATLTAGYLQVPGSCIALAAWVILSQGELSPASLTANRAWSPGACAGDCGHISLSVLRAPAVKPYPEFLPLLPQGGHQLLCCPMVCCRVTACRGQGLAHVILPLWMMPALTHGASCVRGACCGPFSHCNIFSPTSGRRLVPGSGGLRLPL